jgi:hypothetical protein
MPGFLISIQKLSLDPATTKTENEVHVLEHIHQARNTKNEVQIQTMTIYSETQSRYSIFARKGPNLRCEERKHPNQIMEAGRDPDRVYTLN